jgi:hypothetical protein
MQTTKTALRPMMGTRGLGGLNVVKEMLVRLRNTKETLPLENVNVALLCMYCQ